MILEVINSELADVGLPYEFGRWTGPIQYPYFVGEFVEVPLDSESGKSQYTVMLTGFTRGAYSELIRWANEIKSHFPKAGGLRSETEDGAVVIFYENSQQIPTGDAELKKIQIDLDCYEWRNKP